MASCCATIRSGPRRRPGYPPWHATSRRSWLNSASCPPSCGHGPWWPIIRPVPCSMAKSWKRRPAICFAPPGSICARCPKGISAAAQPAATIFCSPSWPPSCATANSPISIAAVPGSWRRGISAASSNWKAVSTARFCTRWNCWIGQPAARGRQHSHPKLSLRLAQALNHALRHIDGALPDHAAPIIGVGIEGLAHARLDGAALGAVETTVGMEPIVASDGIDHVAKGLGAIFKGDAADLRSRQRRFEANVGIAGDGCGGGTAVLARGGFAAEPILDAGETAVLRSVIADDLPETIGSEAGVKIDEPDMAGIRRVADQNLPQGPVRPSGGEAAIEHALVIDILAHGDGRLQRHGPVLRAKGLQLGVGGGTNR